MAQQEETIALKQGIDESGQNQEYGSTEGSVVSEPHKSVAGEPLSMTAESVKKTVDEPAQQNLLTKCVGEFLGTFMLVFTVATVSLVNDSQQWNPTACCAVLTVLIASVGPVSGAHLNPAVSLALLLAGKAEWMLVLIYSVLQMVAGILAALACTLMFDPYKQKYGRDPVHLPVPDTDGQHSLTQMLAAEFLFTCFLLFVVLNCAASKRNSWNQFFPLAIGFVIIVAGHSIGGISGGCLNPAVAVGVEVSYVSTSPKGGGSVVRSLVYSLVELAGASCAVCCFWIVRPEEMNPDDAGFSGTSASILARFASEVLGTFYLVLTVGLNVLAESPATAWSAAAALMCMIFSLGDVSGGNFNPAVTISLMLSGRGIFTARDAVIYVCGQLVGACLAGVVWSGFDKGDGDKSVPLPPVNFGLARACVSDAIFTFVLCYTVLAVASTKQNQKNHMFGLIIASCVTAGGFAIGRVSGGELNPAVAIGILSHNSMPSALNSAMNTETINKFVCLAFSEIGGGILATMLFYITYPQEFIEPKLPK